MEVRKIYFDLDGVLADFARGVNEMCGMEATQEKGDLDLSYDDDMWDAIRKVGHFYDKLKPMEGAKELFDELYAKYGDKCEILSGIPKPRRGITTAGDDKISWVKRVLSDDIRINIVFREDKPDFCFGEGCILIDDLAENIDEWKKSGGTGIISKSAGSTREKLVEMGLL